MKQSTNPAKELYKQLRTESWETLWEREVPQFDASSAEARLARVGLVRAIGVVALEKATQAQRQQTRAWLTELLQDPEEKIRRYAMNALPKLGARNESEKAVIELLDRPTGEREVKSLNQTLGKIGGEATLAKLEA